jgi:hypothetical protein
MSSGYLLTPEFKTHGKELVINRESSGKVSEKMPTPAVVPDIKVSNNSNAAEHIRRAHEVLEIAKREIVGISETLNNPYAASMHITRALNNIHNADGHLHDTGVFKYRQEELFQERSDARR